MTSDSPDKVPTDSVQDADGAAITIRKQAETEAPASRSDLNRAQAVAHVGSWRLDMRKNQLSWSEENCRIFGVPNGTPLTYETFMGIVHPDDRAYVHAQWTAALRGAPYDIEHRIVVGGEVKWVRERAELEFDQNGELQGGFGTTQDVTDLKTVQYALNEAHARAEWLARFPEENPEPVLRVALDGVVLYANPAAIDGSVWISADGKFLTPRLRSLLEQAMAARAPIEQDIELGDRTYAVAIALFTEEGYVNLYGRDVTERNLAVAAAIRARQEWERTFDSVTDLIAILDDSHRIVRANQAMARKLGRTPQACIGLACHEVMHGCGAPFDACPHSRTLQDGIAHTLELHEERLGGDFLVTTTPLTDSHGRMIATVHVARDITELKAMQQREREAAIRLAWGQSAIDTINAMREGVILMEMDFTITSANLAVDHLTGLRGETIIGRNILSMLSNLLDQKDSASLLDGMKQLRDGEIPDLPIVCLRRPDGQTVYVLPTVSWMQAPDGARRLVVLTLKDMTELHTAGQRVRALAERLAVSEEQNRWRISRYIHDTIIQNLSLSNIRLGTMEQSMADTALAKERDKLHQVQSLIESAIDECRTVMSDLTPALLYELGLVPALKDLARQLKAKQGARVSIEGGGSERTLPNQLRGLLFESARELIMNALKYAGPCDIRVAVDVQSMGLTLRVTDNGLGFDPATAGTMRNHSGGFGLFNIRQRLDGLGGRLDIESASGKGTTATITTPLA